MQRAAHLSEEAEVSHQRQVCQSELVSEGVVAVAHQGLDPLKHVLFECLHFLVGGLRLGEETGPLRRKQNRPFFLKPILL